MKEKPKAEDLKVQDCHYKPEYDTYKKYIEIEDNLSSDASSDVASDKTDKFEDKEMDEFYNQIPINELVKSQDSSKLQNNTKLNHLKGNPIKIQP